MADKKLNYKQYLKLDKILSSQRLLSERNKNHSHDEMLFIIIHQTYELWFKQIIYELDSIINYFSSTLIDEKHISLSVSRLERIIEIQKIIVDQIRVLETMTPMDFLDFREYIHPASGFQSYQFRQIENKLGLNKKDRHQIDNIEYKDFINKDEQINVIKTEEQNSLFQLIENWLERTPFLDWGDTTFWIEYEKAVDRMLNEDIESIKKNSSLTNDIINKRLEEINRTKETFGIILDESKHQNMVKRKLWSLSHNATKAALLIFLYRDQPILNNPYRFLSKIMEVDDLLTNWRYKHLIMVSKMIGKKMGTGGSSGADYLNESINKHKIFSDFASLTTFLIPRSSLPPLPEKLTNRLNFNFNSY